jgi:hypothetical protein
MNADIHTAAYLDAAPAMSEDELAARSGLTITEVHMLVECGALVGSAGGGFSVQCLAMALRAQRLREELALEDAHALAVLMRMRQRIADLEAELDSMRALLWR